MIVVAGVDDSPRSEVVLRRASEQAVWRGADLHVVHVTHVPMVYAEVPIDLSQVVEAQRRAVWESVDGMLSALDIPAKRVDLDGYPPDELVS